VGGCFSDEDLDDVGREESLEAVEFALRSPLLVGTDQRRESDRGCTRRRTLTVPPPPKLFRLDALGETG
jgi:hypothetical protein